MECLCTSISDSIPSPAELLNDRVYKGFQPFLKPLSSSFQVTKETMTDNLISLKEKEEMNHDKQVTELPKINEDSDVWYCDHNKDVWGKCNVVELGQNGSIYTLVNEHGKIVSHNHVEIE